MWSSSETRQVTCRKELVSLNSLDSRSLTADLLPPTSYRQNQRHNLVWPSLFFLLLLLSEESARLVCFVCSLHRVYVSLDASIHQYIHTQGRAKNLALSGSAQSSLSSPKSRIQSEFAVAVTCCLAACCHVLRVRILLASYENPEWSPDRCFAHCSHVQQHGLHTDERISQPCCQAE